MLGGLHLTYLTLGQISLSRHTAKFKFSVPVLTPWGNNANPHGYAATWTHLPPPFEWSFVPSGGASVPDVCFLFSFSFFSFFSPWRELALLLALLVVDPCEEPRLLDLLLFVSTDFSNRPCAPLRPFFITPNPSSMSPPNSRSLAACCNDEAT
eukprot:SAG31_NODE_6987_length_1826_cov_2.045165_2_plen_153_part_00